MRLNSAESERRAPPDNGQQVILAHHPVAMADQIHQQIEHLRFDSHQGSSPMQLPPIYVDRTVLEEVAQARSLRAYHAPTLAQGSWSKNGGKHESKLTPPESGRGSVLA